MPISLLTCILHAMGWEAFLYSFGSVFAAEFGDKTQLAILLLASRYGTLKVFGGAAAAFALMNALSVGAGNLAFRLVPEIFLRITVSALFLLLGLLSLKEGLRGEEEEALEEENRRVWAGKSPFLHVFLLICLMELGDKTQFLLAGLSARHSQPLLVFLGGTSALWVTSLLGAFLGERVARLLSPRVIKVGAGVLFIVFAVLFFLLD